MANNVIVSGSTDRTLKVSNLSAVDTRCTFLASGVERRERDLRAHVVRAHFHSEVYASPRNKSCLWVQGRHLEDVGC